MRILIADDHAVVRHGLKQILAEAFPRAVFGEAANSQQTLERVRKESWTIVILDLTMPGRSGLEVLAEIKRARPSLPVLILSMHPEDQFAVRLLKAGAAGYMTKESAPEELVGALRKAIAGGRYISAGLAEKMASLLVNDTASHPHEALSDREFVVLRLIASGKPVGAIAVELSLSVKTVSTYRARLLEKMGMSNNAQLVHYAFQNNLVPRPAHHAAAPPPETDPAPRPSAPGKSKSVSSAHHARRMAPLAPSRPPRRRPFDSL